MWQSAENILKDYKDLDIVSFDIEYNLRTGRFRTKRKNEYSWMYWETKDMAVMYLRSLNV